MSPIRTSRRKSQQGAALVVVLILLLIMTWMGVSSMRGTTLGERMSGAVYDRSIAFQASESALREAEAMLQAGTVVFPVGGCTNGVCAERTNLTGSDVAYWSDPAVVWREATDALAVDSDGDGTSIATNPEFIIEAMGTAPNWPGCDREDPVSDQCMSPRYRVTARSSEANRAQVILQTSVSAQQ
jgi:type IV pilus assembly protein PilX